MTELNEIKLTDIIPASISNDRNIIDVSNTLDISLKEISNKVEEPLIYMNLEELSSKQLDHVAMSWDASVWRDSWPLDVKVNVLKTLIFEKRTNGTLSAVKAAINSIGSISEVVEWWQETPRGTPHTFKVIVSINDINGIPEVELQEDIIALVEYAKPIRSHFDFIIKTEQKGGINICGHTRKLTYARSKQKIMQSNIGESTINIVAGSRVISITNLLGN